MAARHVLTTVATTDVCCHYVSRVILSKGGGEKQNNKMPRVQYDCSVQFYGAQSVLVGFNTKQSILAEASCKGI